MKKNAIKCPSCGSIHRYKGAFPFHPCPYCGAPLITHLMGNGVNKGEKLERVTITLPKDQIQLIKNICKKHKVKRSTLIRTILCNTLRELQNE